MYQRCLAASVVLLALCVSQSSAQTPPKPADPPRAAAVFDAASIRRQAAQIAEFRALLSDPDATIRLITMREAIRAGDAVQRQIAIEAGLASSESTMLDVALRGVMMNIQQMIIEFVDADGKPTTEGGAASLRLTVGEFNPESGQIRGTSVCSGGPKWSGQSQGVVFSFNSESSYCSGTLNWTPESGDFRGRVNINGGTSQGNRNAIWKPR